MIRILCVCKNEFYLRALEPFLHSRNILIAGICKNPEDILAHFISAKADLIVMDANWYGHPLSGANILKELLRQEERIKVIMVTNCAEGPLAARMKRLGAMGYFCRMTSSVEQIAQCITRVHEGHQCFVNT